MLEAIANVFRSEEEEACISAIKNEVANLRDVSRQATKAKKTPSKSKKSATSERREEREETTVAADYRREDDKRERVVTGDIDGGIENLMRLPGWNEIDDDSVNNSVSTVFHHGGKRGVGTVEGRDENDIDYEIEKLMRLPDWNDLNDSSSSSSTSVSTKQTKQQSALQKRKKSPSRSPPGSRGRSPSPPAKQNSPDRELERDEDEDEDRRQKRSPMHQRRDIFQVPLPASSFRKLSFQSGTQHIMKQLAEFDVIVRKMQQKSWRFSDASPAGSPLSPQQLVGGLASPLQQISSSPRRSTRMMKKTASSPTAMLYYSSTNNEGGMIAPPPQQPSSSSSSSSRSLPYQREETKEENDDYHSVYDPLIHDVESFKRKIQSSSSSSPPEEEEQGVERGYKGASSDYDCDCDDKGDSPSSDYDTTEAGGGMVTSS